MRNHNPRATPSRAAAMVRRSDQPAETSHRERAQRWYQTKRWKRIRALQLRAAPLCAMCEAQGLVTVATVCDHAERHEGDEVKFWSGPFQSLCKLHHDIAKQQIETRGYSSEVDASGVPVDKNHPFNR